MTLSDISIKNPVFAWMLMVGLMLFGYLGFRELGVGNMPDVDFPVVNVTVTWEGAAPEVMESDVADIVEDSIMSIQGIREVSSSTRLGQTDVTIEFDLDRNIDVAFQEVQTKISQAQQRLPKDIDPPIIAKVNPGDHPILFITLTGSDRSKREVMEYAQDTLKDRFQTINGVGDIMLGGLLEKNLRVWVSYEKLKNYQLTVNDVIKAIETNHVEKPAGLIENDKTEMNVRAMGEAQTVEDFGNIVIPKRNGLPIYTPIRIKDVAWIEDGLADIRKIARSDGKVAVGLGIRKQRGANAVAVGRRVKERLKEVRKELPKGMHLNIGFDSTKFAEENINELLFTLFLSCVLTGLICWIFLGSWSSTLNVLLAIPTSILGCFLIFKFANFTLNTFTVLGLSLSIGIIVDDAIMVLENIVRHREKGHEQVEAATLGARQITSAAIAASLALVAIFLPVAFMRGIIGRFFFQFAVTISVAVMLSLLEALTLAPMRCSQFLQIGQRTTRFGRGVDHLFEKTSKAYRFLLAKALERRVLVIAAAVVVFIISLILAGILRKEFTPAQDQSIFMCRLQTPVGSSMEYTGKRFELAENFVRSRPELKTYVAILGGFTGGESNSGFMFISLKDKKDRPVVPPNRHRLSQQELIDVFRTELNKIPDVKAAIQDLSISGFTAQRGFPIEFSVRGRDWNKLAEYSQQIMAKMKASKYFVDVDTDYLLNTEEIQVKPNRQNAQARGVNMEDIGKAINAQIGGERVGKYTKGGRRYDVRVRLVSEERQRPEDIDKLYVWNNHNEIVSLADVVSLEKVPSLITITRRDRERAIGIFSNVAKSQSQSLAMAEVDKIAKQVLPEGYRLVFSGGSKLMKESMSGLLFAFVLGMIVAYMILASQYNSYVHPFTILLAMPFGVAGALIALYLGNQSLNIYSMIGLILLMGIVKKNSILLVDFTNQLREQGKGHREALMEACPIRLRPILMTSVSNIAAALPAAVALGPGAETRMPMAIAVIGGVILSTILTLFVVPCAYSLLTHLERRKTKHPEPRDRCAKILT